MFSHSLCTDAWSSATIQGNGFIPIMFVNIIDHKFSMILMSGFLADNRRLVTLARTSWLILAVWGFAPPCIKTVLFANAWLSTCGLKWGLTISSIYFCAVRPSWMSSPACNFVGTSPCIDEHPCRSTVWSNALIVKALTMISGQRLSPTLHHCWRSRWTC